MSQTKTQLVANVPSGFNVTGVVTATKFDGALATNATGTNLTLSGDLTVQGSQTIINSDTLDVKDKTVGIASTATPTSATQDGSGIEIYGPSNVTIKYDDQKGGVGINTGITVTGVGTFSGAVTAASFSGDGSAVTGVPKIEKGNTTAEVVDTGSDGHFKVTTEGTERPRVISSGGGRVGIKTASPASALHVLGKSSLFGNGEAAIEWGDNAALGSLSFSGVAGNPIVRANTGKDLLFQTNGGNTRLTIDSGAGFKFSNSSLTEKVKITAGKLSDNQNINLDNGMVHYFTTTETTTSTPNITASAGINTIMSTGDTMTVTLITTAAAGGYSAQLTIEGAATTENWIGGEVPAAGGASGVDIYSYTIIKTGSAAYTVIGNLSKTSA
tara:strand:+ start:2565 stop:3719 length:1155 start_codon:yes stop_codon:yes gene_type:complete